MRTERVNQKVRGACRVLVIVPAYNEAGNILSTLTDLRENTAYDCLVVDDGSTDETLLLCREYGVPVVSLPMNLGIGGAVQAGYKYAYRNAYDVAVQFDGDGQHDATFIVSLVAALEDEHFNMAIGSRFSSDFEDNFKSTRMRRVGIRWLSGVIYLFTHQVITDPTSGFRAVDRAVMKLFCESYPVDYPEPESAVVVLSHGLKIKEVGVMMNERKNGLSSIGSLSAMYYMVKVTLAVMTQSASRVRGHKKCL